jgi:hypothetical protein
MKKQTPLQPQQPKKQAVRTWLFERAVVRQAPPDRNQIRRILGWGLL